MSKVTEGIVVNTSPWIALSICGQVSLLERLYTDVYIPYQVREEIIAGGKQNVGVKELEASHWLKVERVANINQVALLYELEDGEAEVIILAKEKGIGNVLIDEKIARLQAKVLGLDVIGTLGLLLKAKKMGYISQIKPLIIKLRDNGIWIKDEIVIGILDSAGEK